MRGKPISGNPEQDGPLLLDEIDPTRKKWKLGKTKVRQHYNFCFEIFMKLLTSAVLSLQKLIQNLPYLGV
jgi:hypothetical protein